MGEIGLTVRKLLQGSNVPATSIPIGYSFKIHQINGCHQPAIIVEDKKMKDGNTAPVLTQAATFTTIFNIRPAEHGYILPLQLV